MPFAKASAARLHVTVRLEMARTPGLWDQVKRVVHGEGGRIRAVDPVKVTAQLMVRDASILAGDEDSVKRMIRALEGLEGVRVVNLSDRVFLLHLGGKIDVVSRVPIKSRDDLSLVYTPGVAEVCLEIAAHPEKARNLTMKKNMVAIVTDGTAVLGLGDIGPEAALPVMEGKAMLFREFGGVNAFPICLNTKDIDEIVRTVVAISPGFGGINLEDIASPRCFEIERRLKERLSIPVFHDDQHGTAVVVLAGLYNAFKLVGKVLTDARVVIQGSGAAGVACARLLRSAGVGEVFMLDREGLIYQGRQTSMNAVKEDVATWTNVEGRRGGVEAALEGADVFLGLSGPRTVAPSQLGRMSRDPIVFAMSNPDPEVDPDEAAPFVRVMATGRSDYPNQINNALCFPGFFRGLLDAGAVDVTEGMKVGAARAIAETIAPEELDEEYIIPSLFNKRVAPAVAEAVAREFTRDHAARTRLAAMPGSV